MAWEVYYVWESLIFASKQRESYDTCASTPIPTTHNSRRLKTCLQRTLIPWRVPIIRCPYDVGMTDSQQSVGNGTKQQDH